MTMPIIPPFAVAASYQNSQFGSGNLYTPGVPSVFGTLVSPPTSGVNAETWSTDQGETVGFTGNAAQNEVQTITVSGSPTGGTFQLGWGDQLTGSLAYNASAAAIQSALNGLSSVPTGAGGTNDVQTVTISGTPTGGTFTLTFGAQTTAAIAYNATAADVQSALAALSSIGASTGASYAAQTIDILGSPTGGTFTLSFGGQTTSAIAYNATASTIQTALQALSSIGSGNATVSGQVGGPFNVTFAGTLTGPQALITGNASSLTGGAGAGNAITVSQLQAGIAGSAPNVTVTGGPGPGTPYVVTFGGSLGKAAQTAMTATGSFTGGSSPAVAVAHTTTGTSPTPCIAVTGSNGGPWTCTFQGVLGDLDVAQIIVFNEQLTGGTTPAVTVATTTSGQPAFSDASTNYWQGNLALRNQVQQHDPMVTFYDQASFNAATGI